jgi:hypothetical protein
MQDGSAGTLGMGEMGLVAPDAGGELGLTDMPARG